MTKDVHLFARKLILKTLFYKKDSKEGGIEFIQTLSKTKCRALKELLTSEEDPPYLPATPPEPDLIELLDLDTLLKTNAPSLKQDLSTLKNKSQTLLPSSLNSNMNLFLQRVFKEMDLPLFPGLHSNLSTKLQKAFNQLKSYSHLVIKFSDKGGNVVVFNVYQYRRLGLDILYNPSWYKRVPDEMIEAFTREFYTLVDSAYEAQIISKPLGIH